MFIPTTKAELDSLGWKSADVILITGDAYVDSPFIGVAVIGKVLMDAGYRVGIIAQPDIDSDTDITRLGEPGLFWGITSGCIDSMIANYTASGKKRRQDDLTAGGRNDRRPDRAVIAYSNLVRRYFKKTVPIVLGGLEASMRRISHFDFSTDSIRRSILFDAKADILVYGMGERTVVQLAERIRSRHTVTDVRGICYISSQKKDDYIELPPHADVATDSAAFTRMFKTFYENSDPVTAKGLYQRQDNRYLIHNPPQFPLTTPELDRVHELDFERDVHPRDASRGTVRALDTVRFSLTTHRGCYGECLFCAISVHQGRSVIDRSETSLLREATALTKHPQFKGIIQDVGGPTANMYGIECKRKTTHGACRRKRCLTPTVCRQLTVDHCRQIALLRRLRKLSGVKHVFIGSGIRHDLVVQDTGHGADYLEEILRYHTSGQLKLAPEHCDRTILKLMGKPSIDRFIEFKRLFDTANKRLKKKRFLTCYFIAAFPGCTLQHMLALQRFTREVLGFRPRQVQIFTPTPSTPATLMYHTGKSYDAGKPLFVEKNSRKKEEQKNLLLKNNPDYRKRKTSS